jgi:hypothetical protein
MYQMTIEPLITRRKTEMVSPAIGAGSVGSRRRSWNCSVRMKIAAIANTAIT